MHSEWALSACMGPRARTALVLLFVFWGSFGSSVRGQEVPASDSLPSTERLFLGGVLGGALGFVGGGLVGGALPM